jgi:predicted amino acid-binding ACT domain protein
MLYSTLRKSIFVLVVLVSFADHAYLTNEISTIHKEIKTEIKIEKQDISSSIDLDCNQ